MTEVKWLYAADLLWPFDRNFSWLKTPESVFWPLQDSLSWSAAPPAGKDPKPTRFFIPPYTDIMVLFVSTLTNGRVILNPSSGVLPKRYWESGQNTNRKNTHRQSRGDESGGTAACSGARESGLVGKTLQTTAHGSVCVRVEKQM